MQLHVYSWSVNRLVKVLAKLKHKYQGTNLWRSTRILSRKDQKKILAVVVLQASLSLLDLVGVSLIGIIGALAIRGVSSQSPGDRVNAVLDFLHLQDQSFQVQVACLALGATLILILRTIFSIFFTRRTLKFLALRGAQITEGLFSRLLSQSLLGIQKRSSQETLYALTNGVSVVVIGILGTLVAVISDASILIVLAIGVFLVDPTTALLAGIFFAILGMVMYKVLHSRVRTLGVSDYQLTIESNERILEVLGSYRENVVKNRRLFYVREIGSIRKRLANVQAELSFTPYISKYVIETGIILGAVLIGGIQFLINDASRAVATLAIFLAAGTRIAPAVLRVQQGAILIKGNLAVATPTLDLLDELNSSAIENGVDSRFELDHQGFVPVVEIRDVSFSYPFSGKTTLKNIDLRIESGQLVAFVGSSGSGKTTLVDVILGVLNQDSGSVLISNLPPSEAVAKWPGSIGYVPQDVLITNSTIRANITMGYESQSVPEAAVWNALRLAQLDDFVSSLPEGLDTFVGDRGTKLSGGQRQRLGIARALLTKPKFIVLDEATSSLDGETEVSISDAISNLRGNVTVILVAHRLSSIRSAENVYYLDSGKIVAAGSFEEVRRAVPDFDKQARSMGL